MRALTYHGKRDVRVETVPDPRIEKPDDVIVRAFAGIGWEWGGDWRTLKDYQHFSLNGS